MNDLWQLIPAKPIATPKIMSSAGCAATLDEWPAIEGQTGRQPGSAATYGEYAASKQAGMTCPRKMRRLDAKPTSSARRRRLRVDIVPLEFTETERGLFDLRPAKLLPPPIVKIGRVTRSSPVRYRHHAS